MTDLLIHTNFVTPISTKFFYASKKCVSVWIYGYLISHWLKKRSFMVT